MERSLKEQRNVTPDTWKSRTVHEVHAIAQDAFNGLVRGGCVGAILALLLEVWIVEDYIDEMVPLADVKRTTTVAEGVFATLAITGIILYTLGGFASRRIHSLQKRF